MTMQREKKKREIERERQKDGWLVGWFLNVLVNY